MFIILNLFIFRRYNSLNRPYTSSSLLQQQQQQHQQTFSQLPKPPSNNYNSSSYSNIPNNNVNNNNNNLEENNSISNVNQLKNNFDIEEIFNRLSRLEKENERKSRLDDRISKMESIIDNLRSSVSFYFY